MNESSSKNRHHDLYNSQWDQYCSMHRFGLVRFKRNVVFKNVFNDYSTFQYLQVNRIMSDHVYAGADPGFSWRGGGGGDNVRVCTSSKPKVPYTAGDQGSRVFGPLLCYLSLFFFAFWYKLEFKKLIPSNFRGTRTCCAHLWIRHWYVIIIGIIELKNSAGIRLQDGLEIGYNIYMQRPPEYVTAHVLIRTGKSNHLIQTCEVNLEKRGKAPWPAGNPVVYSSFEFDVYRPIQGGPERMQQLWLLISWTSSMK